MKLYDFELSGNAYRIRLMLALLGLDYQSVPLKLMQGEQLEQALDSFAGTVLLVTHDRSLLERTRITRSISLAAGRIVADVMA